MFKEDIFFFYQKRVNSIARSLEALSYQEGLTELEICSGQGKMGVNRIVFRR